MPNWGQTSPASFANGWGFESSVCSGEDSRSILCPSELTYTCYMLEIVGQMIPLLALRDELPEHALLFVDNEPAKHALLKGYGKDDSVKDY